MQFQKKTRFGNLGGIIKLLIKVFLILLVLFVGIILLDRIDFPSPIKKIEKVISNENFKTVK
jgi:GT2 family glycosyltransferase|tara:strand:- start:705 stop:890 length:186 start_codon:yes stop_codon:yes gene_type:complete